MHEVQTENDYKLLNATMKQDIGIFQRNYEYLQNKDKKFEDKWLRLYSILCDSDAMHELKYALEENQNQLDKDGNTLSYLFRPMIR